PPGSIGPATRSILPMIGRESPEPGRLRGAIAGTRSPSSAGHDERAAHHQGEEVMSEERRVAIVTGASQGLGAAIVAGYRDRGFAVVATARSIAPSRDELVVAVPGDIRERATAEKVLGAAKERFGRIDTLVNNAGVFVAKPFIEYTPEEFAAVTETNVTGGFHLTQLALAAMLACK